MHHFIPSHIQKILFLFCIISPFTLRTLSDTERHELYAQEMGKRVDLTARFEKQIKAKFKELETYAQDLKKDPLFHELEQALSALEQEWHYKSYAVLTETLALVGELQTFNYGVANSDLLKKTGAQLKKLEDPIFSNNDHFESLRSILKKQRIPLIEFSDEKDLIDMTENHILRDHKNMAGIMESLKEGLEETAAYKNTQAVQKKYLALPLVKKAQTCITKIYDLQNQSEITLLKNKEYQRLVRRVKRIDTQFYKEPTLEAQMRTREQALFLVPLEEIL